MQEHTQQLKYHPQQPTKLRERHEKFAKAIAKLP